MAWVVDTSVLLDIRMNDIRFGLASASCLASHLQDGLVISPMTYVELAPAFNGDPQFQEAFLEQIGIDWAVAWTRADTQCAHRLWADQIQKKRAGNAIKRPVADVFIEAFAKRHRGLITRNPKDFPNVRVVVPSMLS